MRHAWIASLGIVLFAGCGSGSKSEEMKSAGIPLSIPGAVQPVVKPAAEKTVSIDQYSETVKKLLQKANAAVVAGKASVAVEALSQAIGITPEDASLFRMRADVYALQGENANARADFSTAIRLSPENADLYNFRGYFLMSQGLSTEGKADFDKAVQLNPKHAAALNNRGLLALTSSDYKAAEAEFSKAIESNRRFSDAWNNRGFARMKQQQFDTALSDIRQALQLKDDYVTAWNNLGLIYMQQKNFEEAEKAFARAVELEPMDVRWMNHHRAALLGLNRFADAQEDARTIEWLEQLSALTQQAGRNARNPDLWILRGRHLLNGQQYGAAVQDFTRALIVNPGNASALLGRATAWAATGDIQKAMLDCDESLVANPSREAYSFRGDLWMKLENLDQAIADFEQSGRFDEQVALAYEKRATKHREEGAAARADEDATRAKEIREAMVDKPKDDSPTSFAEGFDPAPAPAN